MEDAKEKVKAWSFTATEVTDGSTELGDQIDRLMVTLNRAEQGTCPASTPNSPRYRDHRRGQKDRNAPVCPSFHNGQTGLGQNTPAGSSSAAIRIATASQSRGVPKHQQVPRAMPKMRKTLVLCSALDIAGLGSYG